MDQLKTFLRQCVVYRFWIAAVLSMILPMIGYFAGAGAYTEATTKRVGEIKGAEGDVGKYTGSMPNPEYPRIVAEKKEALTKDVDATQRKLYQMQEPLMKWPEVVEEKFRTWGRKWPADIDRGQIQQAINDYTNAYPDFVKRVYATLKPWEYDEETGKESGIVSAPDMVTLVKPAPFTLDTPPQLGKVWAEQERLWVMTAIFDVIAKVNDEAKAKDWDGAWIKQVVNVDVGSPLAQDQVSLAKGKTLDPSPVLAPDGAAAPAAAPTDPTMGGPMGGAQVDPTEVYSLKSDTPQPYKVLPIQLTVMVDQNRLPEFLVALENSPMGIQVLEPEIAKPAMPVTKPIAGLTNMNPYGGGYGPMGGGPMRGAGAMGGMSSAYGRPPGRGGLGPMASSGPGMGSGMMSSGMYGTGGTNPNSKKGVDKGAERKKKALEEAEKAKAAQKKGIDQYFNIIEVTVYGTAKFYNVPPPPPAATPSTEAPSTEAPAAATPPADAPKAEAPAATPPADAPKAETPKADSPAPTGDPAPAPAGAEAPKAEAPKAEPAGTPKPQA